MIGKNAGSANYIFTKKVFDVNIGVNELSIMQQLADDETIGFFDYTDTALFWFGGANAGDKANPIGGAFISRNSNGAWTTATPTLCDLSIGVFTNEGETGINGDINIIKAQLVELEDQIQSVNPDYSGALRNKKFSVLGDSISTYNGMIPSGHPTAYPNYGVTDWRQTWWGLLTTEKYGMELVANASWLGGTITGTGNGSLPNYISKLGANPDYIFIFGGTNDYGIVNN